MFYLRFLTKKIPKKWVNRSFSLIFSFFGERCEWIAHFAQIKWAMWVNRSFCSPKMSDHEQFAQVAQRKWMMGANPSFCSPKLSKWVNCSFFEQIAHLLIFGQKNERFDRKSNERIPSPALGWPVWHTPGETIPLGWPVWQTPSETFPLSWLSWPVW